MRSFIIDGYLVVRPEELGEAFHRELYERSCDLKGWRVGVDPTGAVEPPPPAVTAGAWEGLPEISDLVQAPTVKGALSSLLGPDCVMHPHRALHTSNSYRDQNFVRTIRATTATSLPSPSLVLTRHAVQHKDGHHVPVRDHRPRWMMGLYYPSEVTLDMGPTCVVGGSQYYEVDRLAWNTLGGTSFSSLSPPLHDSADSYD